MIQALAILLLLRLARDTTRKVYRERAVFMEHQQSMMAAWLVWPCPLPLILPFISRRFWFLFSPLPLAMLFFVPVIAVATANRQCFDKSGNPTVKPAAAVVDHVITFEAMGMAGMLAFIVWFWLRKH
jgi:hypothetical protein